MKIQVYLFGAFFFTFSFLFSAEDKAEKITFEDHVFPILENKCLNCHNPDEAKGGLDLSTYGAMMTGGSGGKVVETENPDSSRIYTLMAHQEEPYMPPKKPKGPDAELALIAKWINGGILETSSSKAKKSDKPKMDMSLITSSGKPEGPAAMPKHLQLQPEVVTDRPNAVPALAHSPWAPIVAIAGQKQVVLYHSEDFDVLGILPYPEGFPQSLSFSSSGAILQAGGGRGGKAGNVVAWDVKTGERVFEVGREFDIVLGSDISPNHRHVVMGGPGRIFKIWDTVAGEQIKAVKKHPDWMLTADYSPDGVLLATGGRNSGLYVWEGTTGLDFYTLKGHTKAVTDLAWRPDSNVLASISEDGQAILWEMNEGKQIKRWTAHSGGGQSIDFSPDGQFIATAGRDKTVKLWKGDGAALRTISASDDIVMSVAFSHDSKRVISGDFHGHIKVWQVSDGKELAKLEANPPSIDTQIAYAEQRINEISSKLPELEKGAESAKVQVAQAKAKLNEVATKVNQLSGKKSTIGKEVASLDGKIKTLSDQKTKAEGAVNMNRGLMQKRAAELAAAKKNLDAANAENGKWVGELAKRNSAVDAAKKALDATKATTAVKVFDDPAKESAYRAADAAATAARSAKQGADAKVNASQTKSNALPAQLAAHRKAVADFAASLQKAKQAAVDAQKKLDSANQARKEIDAKVAAASKDGKAAPPTLLEAQKQAATNASGAAKLFDSSKATLTQAEARAKLLQDNVTKTEPTLAQAAKELEAAKADQAKKNTAYAQAAATLKPFLDSGGAPMQAVTKAKAELPAKTAAYQKALADQKNHQNLANQSKTKLAQADAAHKSAQAADAAARDGMADANTSLSTKTKELSSTGSMLNTKKTELVKVEKELEVTAKQKDAQAKTVAAVATKEVEAQQKILLAKADLEQSKFLAQKFRAAALNYAAKLEAEELDDMNDALDGMLDDEAEAKEEVKAATEARISAEQTLAQAKKTVVDGTQKLAETTSSVLDRALKLIASRAAADLREEVVENELPPENTAEVAVAGENPEEASAATAAALPGEDGGEKDVVAVLASTLAVKSTDQIKAEIDSIQKQLEELTAAIAVAYEEADKTKETVDKASSVAAETPKLIAERAKMEQAKTENLKKIESERKTHETEVKKQKGLITELKEKYLKTVPARK